jgi:hypothetical protein
MPHGPTRCGHFKEAQPATCELCRRFLAITGSLPPARAKAPVPLPVVPCVNEAAIIEPCTSEGRHVRGCDLHDRCTRDHVSAKVRACADCRDYQPDPWPSEFAREFHAQRRAMARDPYPENRFSGRGVVICAGGWKQLPGAYVTASMLRWDHVNSRLPIEVWYVGDEGEFDPIFHHLTKHLNVTWRDASAELRRLGIKRQERLYGWALKPLALMLSSFEQVVMLDQDCYPVYDPERLWDDPRIADKPAAFWPDNQTHQFGKPLTEEQWGLLGLRKPTEPIPGCESGVVVVDKRRSWHAVQLAAWMSDRMNHFDRTRGAAAGWHGDKDIFTTAWHATGTPFFMAPPVRYQEVAYLQHDPDGNVCFVHRCNDKPRIAFQDIRHTTQRFTDQQYRSTTLHHDHQFHHFLRELREKLRPNIPGFRDGTQDTQIWLESHVLNTYRLPKRVDGWRILDVGAHAGFFALESLKRGAELVVCVEPFRPNLDQLRMNLAPWTAKARVIEAAVAGEAGTVRVRGSHHGDSYTGEPHVTSAATPFPDLWVGPWSKAKDRPGVRLTCAIDSPWKGEEFFPLIDGPGNDAATMGDAIAAAVRHLRAGGPLSVHCVAGISRSATVAAAALATVWRCSLEESVTEIKRRFPKTDPNPTLLDLARPFVPVPPPGVVVKAVTLADLITELGRVDLLKLDCEGGEKHLIGTDLSAVKRVALEWHSHSGCVPPEEIVAWLEKSGFSVEWNGKASGIGMMYATR